MADFVDSEAEESDVSFFDIPALLEDFGETKSCWKLFPAFVHHFHYLTQSTIEFLSNFAFNSESIDFSPLSNSILVGNRGRVGTP